MKTIRFPRRAVLLGGVAPFLSGCASKFRSYGGPEVTRVRLYKGQRLLVLDGVDPVLQTYPVGLGFAPEGHKQFEGDGRTPEGTYIVDKRNPNSTYHLSIGISYPNEADIAFAEAQGRSPGATSSSMVVHDPASTQRTSATGQLAASRSQIGRSRTSMQW